MVARILSSYEYVNYLLMIQLEVRLPFLAYDQSDTVDERNVSISCAALPVDTSLKQPGIVVVLKDSAASGTRGRMSAVAVVKDFCNMSE